MPGETNATDIGLFHRLVASPPAASMARTAMECPKRGWVMPAALVAADILGWMAVFLWHAGPGNDLAGTGRPLGLFLALAMAALSRHGSYGDGPAALHLRSAATALGYAVATGLLAVAVLQGSPGLMDVFTALALAASAMLGARAGVVLAFRALVPAWLAPRVVMMGSHQAVRELLAACQNDPAAPRLLGWIDTADRNTSDSAGTTSGLPCLGGWNRLAELARAGMVQQVILAGPARETDALVRHCATLPVEIRLARPRLGQAYSPLGTWELAHVMDPPAAFWPGLLKRAEDVVGGGLLLAAFAAPMALVALAVRLDSPGPVLFRQRRIGRHGQPFLMFKFRTMHHDPVPEPVPGCVQAVRGDPRLTRLGAFLRKTSLDELPQLFNVPRGEMSLVGPRPHAPGTSANGRPFEAVVPFYAGRHRVKPGITGLAQVRGLRGETRTESDVLARVEADYEYIARWSLGMDLLILLRTALAVLSMRNAY